MQVHASIMSIVSLKDLFVEEYSVLGNSLYGDKKLHETVVDSLVVKSY